MATLDALITKYNKAVIAAVLREWQLYKNLMPKMLIIQVIHLGGGTPTFFSPENLKTLMFTSVNFDLIYGLLFQTEISILKDKAVQVTKLGFSFVRNICQAFDKQLLTTERK